VTLAVYEYLRDPAEIYAESFRIAESECDLSTVPEPLRPLVLRLVHACGDPTIASCVRASDGAAGAGISALASGATLFADCEMVRAGITRRLLPRTNEIVVTLNDPATPVRAAAAGTTRSAAAVDLWDERLNGGIVAIGNAPTAMFRLLERLQEGAPRPALIICMPVGFVGAAESKAALADHPASPDYITVEGRRGGSPLAAAAVNALAIGTRS